MKDMHASTLENKLLYGYTNYFYENLFGLSWKYPGSYTCTVGRFLLDMATYMKIITRDESLIHQNFSSPQLATDCSPIDENILGVEPIDFSNDFTV